MVRWKARGEGRLMASDNFRVDLEGWRISHHIGIRFA
jgi:hypothetical protein